MNLSENLVSTAYYITVIRPYLQISLFFPALHTLISRPSTNGYILRLKRTRYFKLINANFTAKHQ